MTDFINTVDVLGDSAVLDSIIDGTITEFRDSNIKTIGAGAFRECTALETVCFPNATTIGAGAFRGSGLKAITPDTFPKVTKIEYLYGSHIFGECGLETVDWPSLVTTNEGYLFIDCKSLRSVSLPNWNSYGTYNSQVFLGCSSLTDVDLPKLAGGIGDWFQGCSSLKKITLPLVTEVNYRTFWHCTELEIIDLPSCVKTGGYYTFCDTPKLKALILRSTTMCAFTSNNYTFDGSGIANGVGHVYVPRELLTQYASATNWSTFGSSIFRALEDYTVDGTITGALDEDKI